MEQDRIYRGQIYYVHQQDVVGSEQEGGRPAIIVSNDMCNEHSRVVEVVFLTTKEKPPLPTHVLIRSTNKPSIALCEQIESIDKSRIGKYVNEVSPGEMKGLEKAMMISLQIDMTLRGTKALDEWRKLIEKNKEELGTNLEEDLAPDVSVVESNAKPDVEEHPVGILFPAGHAKAKTFAKSRGDIDELTIFYRDSQRQSGCSVFHLMYDDWKELSKCFSSEGIPKSFIYVGAVMHLHGRDMIIAVTYKCADSNGYRAEIYAITDSAKEYQVVFMEVTEDKQYLCVEGKNYPIRNGLIHITDIMRIVSCIGAAVSREALPAIFSAVYDFAARCCKEVDWYRWDINFGCDVTQNPSSVKTGNDTEFDLERNPAYVRALAERDVYAKLYKELLGSIRTNL